MMMKMMKKLISAGDILEVCFSLLKIQQFILNICNEKPCLVDVISLKEIKVRSKSLEITFLSLTKNMPQNLNK